MNRNIVWKKDVQRHVQMLARGILPEEAARPAPSPDGAAARLLKFIPGEAVGVYLMLEGLVKPAAPPPGSSGTAAISAHEARVWLWVMLIVAVVFNWLYLGKFWHVQRVYQRAISCLALVVYVFAGGGAFSTYEWYKPLYGTFVLAIATAFLIFAPQPSGHGVG